MGKNLKKFLIYIVSILIIAFLFTFGQGKYQEYQSRKQIEKLKESLSFSLDFSEKQESEKKETEKITPKEKFKASLIEQFTNEGYILENRSLFSKLKLFLGGKDKEILKADDGKKIEISFQDSKIFVEKSFEKDILETYEYFSDDNYDSIQLKIKDFKNKFTRTFENIEKGSGIDEFEDGSKIEFKHKEQILTGPAVKYFKNGDREEFSYRNGIKYGFSTYYFINGDKEEVYYINNILEGKAKYTYADGYVEIYKYKNGKRVE
ncbi:MAG: hypothetical protein IJG31_04760 [Fusobacterium sp.]|nr:hypothetical protein [Fusobacterium sp.]